MVLIAHSPMILGWPWKHFSGVSSHLSLGAGVDLFLVISGFVITRSLADSSIQAFWIRRVFRIIPAAWLWLVIGLFLTANFNTLGIFGLLDVNLIDAAASFLQVQNIHYGLCIEETAQACANGGIPFGVYWSLSLEEQFYIVLPLLLLLPRRPLLIALVLVAAIQIVSTRTAMQAQLRTDALILGVLLALWSQHRSYMKFRPAFMSIDYVRLPVIAGLLALLSVAQTFPMGIGLAAITGAILVFFASYNSGFIEPKPNAILLWFGSRSYSLYLCHMSAFACSREIWFLLTGNAWGMSFRYTLTSLALGFLFSEATYRFVEQPMRAKGKELATRPLLALSRSTHG